MKVETVKVNGVMVNKGEEHLAEKFVPKSEPAEEAAEVAEVPEAAEEPAAEVVEEPKKPRK